MGFFFCSCYDCLNRRPFSIRQIIRKSKSTFYLEHQFKRNLSYYYIDFTGFPSFLAFSCGKGVVINWAHKNYKSNMIKASSLTLKNQFPTQSAISGIGSWVWTLLLLLMKFFLYFFELSGRSAEKSTEMDNEKYSFLCKCLSRARHKPFLQVKEWLILLFTIKFIYFFKIANSERCSNSGFP